MDRSGANIQAALQEVRDQLIAVLAKLDKLDEKVASIEVNSAIDILNDRLGNPTSQYEIDRLARKYLGH